MTHFVANTASGLYAASTIAGMIVGSIGVTVILIGCFRGIFMFLKRVSDQNILLADIRIEMGHYLALGLEFLVAKDIIETIVEPTWDDLGKLAVIIALRTALTIFLAHEIKEVREELEQENAIRKIKKSFQHGKKPRS
jgi:uncharacterized membrane protein